MDPLTVSALIGAGSQALNMGKQGIANNKAYKRAQSLRDYDNSYNAPKAQMGRLKEAGLNPAMMYGGSQSVQASSGNNPSTPTTPDFDLQGILQQSLTALNTMAQNDNLKEVNEQLKIRNQGLNIDNIMKDLKVTEQDTKNRYQTSFLDTSLEGLKYKNKLTTADITYRLNENERRTLLTAQSLKKGVGEILQQDLQRAKTTAETKQINAQIGILNSDQQIKDWEVQLSKDGISKNDPIYLKWASKIKDYVKEKAKQVLIEGKNPTFKQDFKNYLKK